METLRRSRGLVVGTLAALAIVLTVGAPGPARAMGGHGFGGAHQGGGSVHQGFHGHHGFEGHHGFDRGGHFRSRFGFVPIYPYYGYYPPAYGYQAPTYWYYCPSYGAYYPDVTACPDAWVTVPAP